MDRTIHFGDDAADARYRIQDTSSAGGDLVLAEDLDGGTVLLEYDYSASEWVSRGPVNLDGNDITNAGSISADTLEAEGANIGDGWMWASYQDGATESDRLQNALAATSQAKIHLESGTYNTDITINSLRSSIIGVSGARTGGSLVKDSKWTVAGVDCYLESVGIENSELIIDAAGTSLHQIGLNFDSTITVKADDCTMSNIGGLNASITFESGTVDGELGVAQQEHTIVDNGNNSIL